MLCLYLTPSLLMTAGHFAEHNEPFLFIFHGLVFHGQYFVILSQQTTGILSTSCQKKLML